LVWRDLVLRPSIRTVQAAQKPNFGPGIPSTSRKTHSGGVFDGQLRRWRVSRSKSPVAR
jgi:hypothetical protein